MPKRFVKSRDKTVTKMTKDGAVERNMSTGDVKRISNRDTSFDLRGNTASDKHSLSKKRDLGKAQKRKILPLFPEENNSGADVPNAHFPKAEEPSAPSWAEGQWDRKNAVVYQFEDLQKAKNPDWLRQQIAEEKTPDNPLDDVPKIRKSKLRFARSESEPLSDYGVSSKARKKIPAESTPSENISADTAAVQADSPAVKPKTGKPKVSKLEHLERRAQATSNKLETARANLPAKRRPRIQRSFNEATGKSESRLTLSKKVQSQKAHIKGALPLRPVKFGANIAIAGAHRKMFQVEDENVGIKAAHRTELAAEGVVRSALRHHKTAPYKKVAKLEQKLSDRSAKLAYNRAVEANPQLKKNLVARLWQKHKIKRRHMKTLRQSRQAAIKAKKAATLTGKATKAIAMFIKKNPKVIIIGVLLLLVINIVSSLLGILQGFGGGGLGAILSATYLSEENDMTAASFVYTQWEMDLRTEIENAETSYPDYDEYRFDLGEIGHSPFELISYLTATHYSFSFAEVQGILREIFDEQYQLSFESEIEIRTRIETDENGDEYEVEYEWRILNVILTSVPLSDVLAAQMDDEQNKHYDVLMDGGGQRQFVANPFSFNWRSSVTSLYGYRVHPITGARDLHRGLDISAPLGTPLHAGVDGIITFAGVSGDYGNTVIIAGGDGVQVRYAHMDSIGVSVSQEVGRGEVIGTVGSTGASTGAHLHIEILRNGEFLNPVFFLMQTN